MKTKPNSILVMSCEQEYWEELAVTTIKSAKNEVGKLVILKANNMGERNVKIT